MFFSSENSDKNGKEVLKNLFYFVENQMLDCNQFIIRDPDSHELTLFDGGNGISLQGLFRGMGKFNLDYQNITKVFLTHEHVDHVLGLYPLIKTLEENPPDIFAYGETVNVLRSGKKEDICPDILGIDLNMFGIEILPLKVNDLTSIQEIGITDDFTFQIHYTPGHSMGSICYYEPLKKILIPGDLVFTGGSFGRYDFPGGSLNKLIDSIKSINNLDVKYLLPGHMGISDNGNRQIELSYKMIQSIGSFY